MPRCCGKRTEPPRRRRRGGSKTKEATESVTGSRTRSSGRSASRSASRAALRGSQRRRRQDAPSGRRGSREGQDTGQADSYLDGMHTYDELEETAFGVGSSSYGSLDESSISGDRLQVTVTLDDDVYEDSDSYYVEDSYLSSDDGASGSGSSGTSGGTSTRSGVRLLGGKRQGRRGRRRGRRGRGSVSEESSSSDSEIDAAEIDLEERPLGNGHFSTVFKGVWRGQEVAVKVIEEKVKKKPGLNPDGTPRKPRKPRDPQLILDQEYDVLKRASRASRYVCQLLGHTFVHGRPSMVMRLYPGGSLQSVVVHNEGLAHSRRYYRYAYMFARAMADVHTRCGLVVRDIKPDNCLLDAHDRVVLGDFGLAGDIGSRQVKGLPRGTRAYMAPEAFERGKVADTAHDVWAFGCSLRYMWDGRKPWTGLSRDEFMLYKSSRHPKIPRNMPVPLKRLIKQCFARNPSERPDATDIAQRLEHMYRRKLWVRKGEDDEADDSSA